MYSGVYLCELFEAEFQLQYRIGLGRFNLLCCSVNIENCSGFISTVDAKLLL
jgi:hypothetical protein